MSLIGKMKINKAFTLIEIMLVVIVIGIILVLAAPNFSKGYSRFELNKTADDLLSVSRWAQAMAIGKAQIYAVSFSDDRHSYDLTQEEINEENNDAPSDQDNFKPVKGALGRMHLIPQAIRLDSKDDQIKFYPDGTIDPATIQLASSDKKVELSSTQIRGMMTRVNDE